MITRRLLDRSAKIAAGMGGCLSIICHVPKNLEHAFPPKRSNPGGNCEPKNKKGFVQETEKNENPLFGGSPALGNPFQRVV